MTTKRWVEMNICIGGNSQEMDINTLVLGARLKVSAKGKQGYRKVMCREL